MILVHSFTGSSYMLFGDNHFAVVKDCKGSFALVLTFEVNYATFFKVEDFAE